MFIETFRGEVGVALDDIYNHRAPGHYVSVLRIFIESDEASDNIGAETGQDYLLEVVGNEEACYTYGISAASVSPRLLFRSSRSSWYMRKRM
jgi:hypothetical protein